MKIIPPQRRWRAAFDTEEWHVSIQKLLKAPSIAASEPLLCPPYNHLRPDISPVPPQTLKRYEM